MESKQVHISTSIVFRTVLVLAAIWFLYLIKDILALLFISVLIVSAIDPVVDWLQKKKIPRTIGVLFIYLIFFAFLGLSISFLIPPISNQIRGFINNYTEYSQKLGNFFAPFKSFLDSANLGFQGGQTPGNMGDGLSLFSQSIFSTTVGVFSGIISTIVVFSLTFYMAVKEDAINHFVVSVMPEKHKAYAANLTERIKFKIGKWTAGQLALMFVIFVLDFIGLSIIGVPYPLVLALFAGAMELVPYMGPIISAIPGILLGFSVSPTVGFLALAVYTLVQQFENNLITPQIMKKAVGLNPIAVILALLVGLKLGGVLWAILAIPIATVVSIFVGDLMQKKEE